MKRYLALGDSYTIGEDVAPEERWPEELVRLLRAEGIDLKPPQIIARTGWTTRELLEGIAQAYPVASFDLVSLLIGVNNQYRGYPQEEYRTELRALLRQAVEFAGGFTTRVLVVSIPDWGVTPFASGRGQARIADEIDAFNHIKRVETLAVGAWFVDVTGVSRAAGADPAMLARDGLHPSGAMYAMWARHALPLARKALLGSHDPGRPSIQSQS